MLNQQTIMLALFIAMGVVLVTGLIAIPVIEEAQARSSTAEENNKGKQGEESSEGKRSGSGGGGINT